jgi:hypothetical protein
LLGYVLLDKVESLQQQQQQLQLHKQSPENSTCDPCMLYMKPAPQVISSTETSTSVCSFLVYTTHLGAAGRVEGVQQQLCQQQPYNKTCDPHIFHLR